MKKRLAVFLLLILLLPGCAAPTDPADAPIPDPADSAVLPAEQGETVEIDSLGLEFAMDTFDADSLLLLCRGIAPLLQEKLLDRGYAVETVNCTIGSANAATAQALCQGGVDVAFLPADAYAEFCTDGGRAILGGGETETVSGVICAGSSPYGEKLTKRSHLDWSDWNKARWGVLAEGDLCRAYASLYLADNCDGSTLDMLDSLTIYDDYDSLRTAAEAGEVDAAVLPTSGALTALAATEPIYTCVAAVSTAKEVISSDQFVRALRESLSEILAQEPELFALYRVARLTNVQESDLDPARRLTTITH